MRNKFFKDGRINLDIVGKTANEVAEYVGLDIPENTPTLLVEITKYGAEEILSKEIMAPVSKYIVYDKFEDGVAMAKANLLNEGAGHSSVIFSNNKEKVEYFYLWEDNESLFEIYKILRVYLDEVYKIPENILLALIKEENLPLKDSLIKIPFIHSGFLEVIAPVGEGNGE